MDQEGGVASRTTDQVGTATLGQLEIPPASVVPMDGVSLEGGQSDESFPQPQAPPPLVESGPGLTESDLAAEQQEDSAPPTPEPRPMDGEMFVDRNHGHLLSAAVNVPTLEGVGEGGGGETLSLPSPPSITPSVEYEDTPYSEQEVEPVMSPTPSASDYGNGDVNSSSASGGVGKSQQEKSVLIRLSNRVRDLEENMTLFTSYLDQLSTR